MRGEYCECNIFARNDEKTRGTLSGDFLCVCEMKGTTVCYARPWKGADQLYIKSFVSRYIRARRNLISPI